MDFETTWRRAIENLSINEFNGWLSYCYGAFQMGGNSELVNESIDKCIDEIIAKRKE